MRRVDERRRAKERRLAIIKTIAGVTIGTVICSIVVTSSATKCYFTSTASAEANATNAQFKDLMKYSFKCADLQNVEIASSGIQGGINIFNDWLIGHSEFNFVINKKCYLDEVDKKTGKYPNDKEEIPKKEMIVNPVSITIYREESLHAPQPIVYFDIDGEIKDYIGPLNPVYCNNISNNSKDINISDKLKEIGSTNIDLNIDFTKFISGCEKMDDIEGTITIGYLNSYKYEKIPVKFTKQYILYAFGRELFERLDILQPDDKPHRRYSLSADNEESENSAKSIMGAYYKLNSSQQQMLDMISPKLRTEINNLINSYNDLTKKYNELLIKKAELEKEIASLKEQNSKLGKENDEKAKRIDELTQQISSLNSEIDRLSSSMSSMTPVMTVPQTPQTPSVPAAQPAAETQGAQQAPSTPAATETPKSTETPAASETTGPNSDSGQKSEPKPAEAPASGTKTESQTSQSSEQQSSTAGSTSTK